MQVKKNRLHSIATASALVCGAGVLVLATPVQAQSVCTLSAGTSTATGNWSFACGDTARCYLYR